MFYGGGGITPDIEIKPFSFTPVRNRIAEAGFQFTRQLAAGLVPGLESYKVEKVLYGKNAKSGDYPITDRVVEAFRNWVRADLQSQLTPAQLDEELEFVKLRLREEIITAAFSNDAGARVLLDADPQLLRALEALPDAKRLAEMVRSRYVPKLTFFRFIMKRIAAVFLLLFAVTLAAGFQDAGEWIKFESTPGLFSVLMPAQPTEEKETQESPYGPYTTNLFQSKSKDEVYIAAWVDYDPKYKFDVQKELEANRDNFVKAVKGTVGSTTSITLKGNPGIEFDGTAPNFSFKSRVYIVGRRPYMLIVLFPAGAEGSPNINKFISSFELLPR